MDLGHDAVEGRCGDRLTGCDGLQNIHQKELDTDHLNKCRVAVCPGFFLGERVKDQLPDEFAARPAFINSLAMQVLESMDAGTRKLKGPLFPDVTPAQSVAFIRACEDAGVKDFSLHDLRHTFASHLRMHGADLHDLQKLLGHRDPRMTDRYAHLSAEHLGNAAKRLDTVLSLAPAAAPATEGAETPDSDK